MHDTYPISRCPPYVDTQHLRPCTFVSLSLSRIRLLLLVGPRVQRPCNTQVCNIARAQDDRFEKAKNYGTRCKMHQCPSIPHVLESITLVAVKSTWCTISNSITSTLESHMDAYGVLIHLSNCTILSGKEHAVLSGYSHTREYQCVFWQLYNWLQHTGRLYPTEVTLGRANGFWWTTAQTSETSCISHLQASSRKKDDSDKTLLSFLSMVLRQILWCASCYFIATKYVLVQIIIYN